MAESIGQVHETKGFRVFYQYIEVDRDTGEEPCMVIGYSQLATRSAWVIPLSSAYRYADSKSGGPTQHLLQAAMGMAKMFNMYPDKSTLMRIADLVLDNLPDLVNMPPANPKSTRELVEHAVEHHGLSVKLDGQEITN